MDKNNPNVIAFKAKEKPEIPPQLMFALSVYMNQDGEYIVEMETEDLFDDEAVSDALFATAMRFAVDHDQITEFSFEEVEGIINANDNSNGPDSGTD